MAPSIEYKVATCVQSGFPLPIGIDVSDGSVGWEGVHGSINALNLECARLLDRPDFS